MYPWRITKQHNNYRLKRTESGQDGQGLHV